MSLPILTPRQLQKGANDARSDDFRRISALVGTWVNDDRDKPELDVFNHTPSITVIDKETGEPKTVKQSAPPLSKIRLTRGVEHDITGGLLTSTSTDWKDPEYVVCQC